MNPHFETSGNTHWWPRSVQSRKRVFKILKKLNRVLTARLVNDALPALPPALWSKMRRRRPDLYAGERKPRAVTLSDIDEDMWNRFKAACKKWKVPIGDALTAYIVVFTKMVENEDKE